MDIAFLNDFGGGSAIDGDVVFGLVAVAAVVARPAFEARSLEGAAADNDAIAGLDGLGLTQLIATSGGDKEFAALEQHLLIGIDALAAIAAAGDGELTGRHLEEAIATNAGTRGGVGDAIDGLDEAVASGGDSGGAACNSGACIVLDAACALGSHADSKGAAIDGEAVVGLDAIAACVVGGISFNGGIGRIRGAVIGVIIFTGLTYCLTFLGIDTNLQFVFKGLILIAAVALDSVKYLKRK